MRRGSFRYIGASTVVTLGLLAASAVAQPTSTTSAQGAEAGSRSAADAATGTADAGSALRTVAITLSPLHLFAPIVELTAEVRVAPKVGVAATFGFGEMTVPNTDFDPGERESITASVWVIGAQGRLYLVGDFDHGMQLGAEIQYVRLNLKEYADITASGGGLAIGPFLGYKVSSDVGFTFDGQLGFAVVSAQAEASTGERSARASAVEIGPLLNLNVGWAF